MCFKIRATINRLFGPILDKDLRVESRRCRTYWMRFLYVAVLSALIGLAWMQVEASRVTVWQTSRMAMVGRLLVTTFVVFQFIAAQMMAVISLSTAISDEIRHRTLGVLMTTPITGLQIVMGKLLSRLLHLLLLLALGLPILAIVRAFGGIPWDYVSASLAVTATAAVFAGAVSLFFSIRSDLAYAVIMRSAFVVLVLYVFLPLMLALMWRGAWALLGVPMGGRTGDWGMMLPYLSPLWAMIAVNQSSMGMGTGGFVWPIHCLVMLLGSGGILFLAACHVRRVALCQATGQLEVRAKALEDRVIDRLLPETKADLQERSLRSVHGPPVVWKESVSPLIRGRKKKATVGLAVAMAVLALLYGINARQGILDEDFAQIGYVMLFLALGTIVTILLVSTPITAEKEAGTWPILLATPLTDRDILAGKALGAVWRCRVVWAFLAGHLLLSVILGFIHWTAVLLMAMLVTGVIAFVCGSGLYLGARLHRTTAAVVMNLAMVLGLWFVVPVVLTMVFGHRGWVRYSWLVNPFVLTESIITRACEMARGQWISTGLDYGSSPFYHTPGIKAMILTLLGVTIGYLMAGLGLAALAKHRLRREIF
jgi:ABC-type transport system involved in multi-copper enzyme maturation permease subunit